MNKRVICDNSNIKEEGWRSKGAKCLYTIEMKLVLIQTRLL